MINSERDRPTQPAKNNSLSAQLFLWHGRGTLTNIKNADACPQSGTRRVVAESKTVPVTWWKCANFFFGVNVSMRCPLVCVRG